MAYRQRNGYLRYEHKPSVDGLDRDKFDPERAGVFPRNLYRGEPVPEARYIKSRPRDTESHYIIDAERDQHPDHFSRFGYGRHYYGYQSGHWPGRWQTNGGEDNKQVLPGDMAPERFYREPFVATNPRNSWLTARKLATIKGSRDDVKRY